MSRQISWVWKSILFLSISFMVATSSVANQAYAAPQQRGSGPTIVILPFQVNGSEELQRLSIDFPEMLGHSLASRGVRIVPQETMLKAIERSKIQVLDAAGAKRLASLAGANYAVFGTINEAGGQMSVDARMVPVGGGSAKPYYIDQSSGGRDLGSTAATLAQRISTEFSPKDAIADIEVRGVKTLDPEVVLMRLTSRSGDKVDSSVIDSDMKKIWDLGYFNDVQVSVEERGGKNILVYTVVEKPRIESISVEGAKDVSSSDIIAVMSTKQGSIYNERLLSEDLMKITELYRKKGYYLASVTPNVTSVREGTSAALVLTVNEGSKQYIKEIRLEGVQQLSESDVRGEMLLSPRGWLSWISGSGVLKEEYIERDATAITSYYLNRGFLDVTVAAAKIDYDEDGIIVTFPVMEGRRYTLGEVSIAGDLIASEADLLDMISVDELAKKGEYFNLSVMQDDEKILTDYYARHGHGYAEVNAAPQKQEGDVANIVFYVEKKHKLYVGRVLVEGNNKTRNNVILREMRLTDGDAFDGDKLRRSNVRLHRLDYFDLAEIELVPTDSEDEVDLKVKVKEKPTGVLMAGVGYSTFSNVGVGGTLMERNLFGKGYMAALQAGFNSRRNAYTLSFVNPRLYDTDFSLGVNLYHWRDDYIDYRKRTTGASVRLSHPIGEYTSVGVGYRFDRYKLYDMDDDVSDLIKRYDTGIRYSSVASVTLIRDSTDGKRPTKGNVDSIQVDYGGGLISGDDHFVAVSLEHESYYQLWKNHVLHGRVKGAALFENGKKHVPVFERFWMGGINTVRGYDSRDIVPRDKKTGDRIGGTRMAFANLEYIWTFSEELGMSLVPFFDVGMNVDDDHSWKWKDEVLRSYGLELRWSSPMGDLRFAYGIPLDDDRRGKRDSGRFEFAMGQTF